MKKLYENNSSLIWLSLVCLLNFIFYTSGLSFLKFLLIVLIILIVFFSKAEDLLPIIFFIHPNSALFDNIGFTYLFNFSVVIVVIKILLFSKLKLPKKSLLLFIILLLFEIFSCLISTFTNLSMFSLVSWTSSYLVLIIASYNQEKISFEKIYRYFFVGFCCAFITGWMEPILKWGVNIPTGYRFTGLLRDPNYYSIDALFLIFSASTYATLCNKNKFLYIIPLVFMGLCSVSKTFILLLFLGIFISIVLNIKKINFKNLILGFIIILIVIMLAYKYGLIDLIMDKYLYRSETTSLLTGRDKLWIFYISSLLKNPLILLFGKSLTYYSKILNPGIIDSFFTNFVAHNTYLDFILSWGIIGTILYLIFLSTIFQNFKNYYSNFKNKEKNLNFILCTTLFLAVIFVLSYLSADVFAILILYLIILKYSLFTGKGEKS